MAAETSGDHGAINVETHTFTIPCKEIKRHDDMPRWDKSEAHRDIVGFIGAMNDAVKNKTLRSEFPVSETVSKLVSVLETLSGYVDEVPPCEQPQRFGNKSFRDWFSKMKDNIEELLKEALPLKFHPAIVEVSVYLIESMGNNTRIDYGTGHELSFIAFLCCLYKIGAFVESDSVAVVFRIFNEYLKLVRKLQLTYRMEPAGSQGVWSLDDHQFVPFIWGSAQLLDHQRIKPKAFTDPDICLSFSKDFMFLGSIEHINKVKTGPFAEHSNQLWNISGVQKWEKVNSGLMKMYKAEVLAKHPVIQHFLFGSLMSINPAT
ncbi:unnamed protein product [Owenia fusiformis]|uniref:Serine/threonine-protein phosphatase 2A activator n=1 Tax=Owenia fusiformis TaxID=6347 RepID=A0A8J1U052_OWEFU|nr:unnamed protein product [Owenia fusiformis]